MTDYAYKWVRTHTPFGLTKDQKNIDKHLAAGFEPVPDAEFYATLRAIGEKEPNGGGLALWRRDKEASDWAELARIDKAARQLDSYLATLPGAITVEVTDREEFKE